MQMPIYFINVANAVRRRALLEERLAQLSLTATRIEGVTPGDLTAADRAKYCDRRKFLWLTETELSCSMSHIRALGAFLETGAELALILEDDLHIAGELPSLLAAYAKAPAVDLLKVESLPDLVRMGRPKARFGRFAVRPLLSRINGTGGYIVNRRAAAAITASPAMRQHPADVALFSPLRYISQRIVTGQLDPGLCRQFRYIPDGPDAEPSSVVGAPDANRDGPEKPPLVRWGHKTARDIDRELLVGVPLTLLQMAAGAKKTIVDIAA